MGMKILKYIVTEKHPFLKIGCIISKKNNVVVLFHSNGAEQYQLKEFDLWLSNGWIKTHKKDELIDLSLNSIKNAVCNILRSNENQLHSENRLPENAYVKRMFCYFAKTYSSYSMRQIGNYVRSKYDHSTVHWAHKKISGLINFDLAVTSDVYAIKKELNLIK
jgi:chromosomal replication initiation ATPase DnaA